MIPVFVYGTLLVGESNHHIVAPYVLSVRPGTVPGCLYDAGEYPGLVLSGPGGGGMVRGEWIVIESEGLAELDRLEEYYGPGGPNSYERVWIRDGIREEREGWTYVWGHSQGYPAIEGGSWRERGRQQE
ncbi:gamma-glutamylcyclotransferase family protein [Paenibacillus filicis]|uniref:Gamma-glutamylcyclotransferase family protein n=1 Tax=Paenibacillus filicis TaxID=669464 RepID=A0ABU9DU27_9BACL